MMLRQKRNVLIAYLCAMAETGTDIARAAQLLKEGRLVAIPTETVYGLAANALNEKAVLAIFEAKKRPHFDPLIIHVPTVESAAKYALLNDPQLTRLAHAFWPGPLTLLLPKKQLVPDLVTSGLNRVAVRVPAHPLTQQLLGLIDFPLAAPSANPFGYVSPTEAHHVNAQLGQEVDYIVDGGSCSVGLESTIAGMENGELCVYRLGGLTQEQLEEVAGPVKLLLNNSSNPSAPGQLKSHYAPRKPLFVGELRDLETQFEGKKRAVLCYGKQNDLQSELVFNLSEAASLYEAAINLFRFMRLADESDAEVVLCQPLPEKGLGRAMNDRLKRAAVKTA